MKKLLTLLSLVFMFIMMKAQTLENSFLVDFGPNDVTNGNITVNPDANGNYWNNPTNPTVTGTKLFLFNKSNVTTPIYFQVTKPFLTNGIQNGGLLAPTSALLGEFAINTATQDYFFTQTSGVPSSPAELKIGGLDPAKGYIFQLFGSRSGTSARISQYKLTGSNTKTYLQTTTNANLGGTGVNQNNSNITKTDTIYPDGYGVVMLELSVNAGGYAYINFMKIEEYSGVTNTFVKTDGIQVTGVDITTDKGSSNMSALISPANATVTTVSWSVNDPSIATIDANGVLTAVKNGEVIVTATSKEGRSTVSASKTINISGQVVKVSQITLTGSNISSVPGTTTIQAKVLPEDATEKGLTWSVSEENIASIDENGLVTSKAEGSVTITATTKEANSTVFGTLQIEITNTIVKASSISVSGNDISIRAKKSQMIAEVLPSNTTDKSYSWSVNDTTIAKIDSLGVLSPVANGQVIVYAISNEVGSSVVGSDTISITGQDKTYFYFDFGPNDVSNGNITPNPDKNGNYWNSPVSPVVTGTSMPVITNQNEATNVSWLMTSVMSMNGIQNGGLLAPEDSLLGEFAINTATQDYFHTESSGSFKLSGLDKNATYVFTFFGSRNSTETRYTEYVATGTNKESKTLQVSGTQLGGPNYNGNISQTVTTGSIYPDASGSITITVNKVQGAYAHINLMKIEMTRLDSVVNYTIQNPGFEEGDLSGWKTEQKDTNSIIVIDSVIAETSTYAVKLSGSNSSISQMIQAGSDSIYYFTGSYYIPSANSLVNGESATLKIAYYDSGMNLLKDAYSPVINNLYEANQWNKIFTKAVLPANTNTIEVKVIWENASDSSQGAIVFDNFTLATYTDIFICENRDELKISFMGSSVAYGTGATSYHGYNYLYSELLKKRQADSIGKDWNTVNISVPGNNTVALLNRWQKDLIPQCGSYVVYGLSLGNEGIHEQGQPMFNQFRDNMLLLINKARANGMEPIIVNCYTRNDYNASDYNFVKQMNLLINSWDVASVNSLGAVDNESGQWVSGYFWDGLHPNDKGHAEMSYTFVPSLFDALKQNKPQPVKINNTSVQMGNGVSKQLSFAPEAVTHPFTTVFDIKTSGNGVIALIQQGDIYGFINIDASGNLVYRSPITGEVIGSTKVNDNEWHKISITHYYSKGLTKVYVDSTLQGSLNEKLVVKKVILNTKFAPATIDYSNWFFYRSAMNMSEIAALVKGKMLKSSLELYAPLDGSANDSLVNNAQSTNSIYSESLVEIDTTHQNTLVKAIKTNDFSVFPNPAKDVATISYNVLQESMVEINVLDISGRTIKNLIKAKQNPGSYQTTINIADSNIDKGLIFLQYKSGNQNNLQKLVVLK